MRTHIFIASIVVWLLSSAGYAGEPKKYNIIAIVTDDQARWAVGAYGNKEVITPNMDRLAKEGALFRNAFTATPVCSPSRAAYMTGKYGTQVGITDYISPAEGKRGVGLPNDAITWAQVLSQHGYFTALIGKWHLGDLPQFHPTKRGFGHFFGFVGGGTAPMNPAFEEGGSVKKFKGSETDILTDKAIDFLKQSKAKPFALCLHYRSPHAPYAPVPEVDSTPFKNLDPTIPSFKGLNPEHVKKLTREYYASVHSIDRNLGRLMQALEELGLAENTIIIFTSDHGYMIGHHGLLHKGNAAWIVGGVNGPRRPNMFDHSIQIPLIVRWPKVVRPGSNIDHFVSNIDTFPTVLGMLGVPAPKGYKHEGQDFAPILRGESVPWRGAVFGQYDLHNFALAYMRSIRTTKYHLVRHYFAENMNELFDLVEDPEELTNLYNNPDYREIRDQLQARLTEWMRSIDDPILAKEKK
ncbi:MAG: sulfatase-like hydrolase/transferase [Gemmataceae bacterium]|nr:sulfatase-like hydrolase/transferase [Gemmataceae bacterium]